MASSDLRGGSIRHHHHELAVGSGSEPATTTVSFSGRTPTSACLEHTRTWLVDAPHLATSTTDMHSHLPSKRPKIAGSGMKVSVRVRPRARSKRSNEGRVTKGGPLWSISLIQVRKQVRGGLRPAHLITTRSPKKSTSTRQLLCVVRYTKLPSSGHPDPVDSSMPWCVSHFLGQLEILLTQQRDFNLAQVIWDGRFLPRAG